MQSLIVDRTHLVQVSGKLVLQKDCPVDIDPFSGQWRRHRAVEAAEPDRRRAGVREGRDGGAEQQHDRRGPARQHPEDLDQDEAGGGSG